MNQFPRQGAPAAKLPAVSTTPVANLPLVSTTLVVNFSTGVVDGVNDTGGKQWEQLSNC
jgi:hypothetical protein